MQNTRFQTMSQVLMTLAWLILPTQVFAQSKALLHFEKGEVSPGLASSIEKNGNGQITLIMNSKDAKLNLDKIVAQLEKELKGQAGLKISRNGDRLVIQFSGPDTPLLQSLSRIEVKDP